MIDALDVFRSFILSKSPVVTLVADRVYAGVTYPPSHYVPGQHAISFSPRGGTISFERQLQTESFTTKCYGTDELHAMALYRTLVQAIDNQRAGVIRHCELEITGIPLREQDPVNWAFVLCYFRVVFNTQLGE